MAIWKWRVAGSALSALLLGGVVTASAGAASSGSVETTPPSVGATLTDELDDFVAEQQTRTGSPGVAYALVGPEGVQHAGYRGVDGNGDPVTERTAFLWGSVSKPVTATLMLQLAATGTLDLDASVIRYLPEFRLADKATSDTITLRQLVDQSSGIPGLLNLTDRAGDRRPGEVLPELRDVALEHRPGAAHTYSSVNYMVLAAAVERVTGRSFAEVLTQRLLGPAGMSGAITTGTAAAQRLPAGNRYLFGVPRSFETPYDSAGLSSGYLGGTLGDLAAFARINLTGGPLLSDRQRAALHTAAASTGPDQGYAMGWRTWPVFGSKAPMVWHGGAVPGFQSSIIVLPERNQAIVVLQNVYGSFQENELLDTGWGLASIVSGADPVSHRDGPLYPALLAVLGLVVVALLAAIVVSLLRQRRSRAAGGESRSGRVRIGVLACWLLGLGVLGYGLLSLPAQFGVGLTQVALWAPDVAVLLWAALGSTAITMLVRIAVASRGARGPRRDERQIGRGPVLDQVE